jgi:hypothetical protein
MFRGALHVHSTYSDGEFSLSELRGVLLQDGCAFACVADHAEWFTEARLQEYLAECEALSDARFTFVPGLEYECENRLHVLGYGSTALLHSTSPTDVIARLNASGCISVIAHPKGELFSWIESFEHLPRGLEVWNSKYDGRYAPRPETFALLHRLRVSQPEMKAFYGQDLHWRHQYRGLHVELDSATLAPADVLGALAAGAFTGCKEDLRLPSSGDVTAAALSHFGRAHRRSDRMRWLLKSTKGFADRLGVSVPAGVKSQLRRVF